MVTTSLKTSTQIQSLTPYYYPRPVTFGNYVELLRGTGFPRWIRNSTAVALGASLVTVLVSCLAGDRKSTRLNSSHSQISYAVFCLKKKKKKYNTETSYHTIMQAP